MINYKNFIFYITASISMNIYAAEKAPNKLLDCPVTKYHSSNYEPETFSKSNNLLRTAGGFPYKCSRKLLIKGIVRDSKCVPLSDVVVKVWQVNENGKYPYKPLRNIYTKQDIDISNSENFTGNGTSITNNKGEFNFITCMPTSFKNIKPHVDFRVYHNLPTYSDYRHFTTKTRDSTTHSNAEHSTPQYSIEEGYINEVIITIAKQSDLRQF